MMARSLAVAPRANSNSKLLPTLSRALCNSASPSSSSSSSHINHLKQIHAKMIRNGGIHDTLKAGKLLSDIAFSGGDNLLYARKLFDKNPSPLNAFMWNSMIRAYAHSPSPEESLALFRRMLAHELRPNNYTFPFVLKACAHLPDPRAGLAVHGSLIRRGFEDFDSYIQTALINFYALCGSIEIAQRLFDWCPNRDVTAWNALIKGYIGCSRYIDAICMFRVMQDRANVHGDEITMLSVVSACAHLGALDMGRWIHSYIDRNRMRLTLNLGTALVNMYAKCGEIDSASTLFREMRDKDVRTWSVMISGLATNGFAKAALDLFAEMQRNAVDPDSVTLTGVLSACSHAGLVQEGLDILERMGVDYLIEPTIEHYGCVVDLLGRAGQLEEALALIKTISLKPDVVLWGALLVACRVHKNVKMGEIVAKEMLALDPNHAGAHVFLSSVYAATRKWDLAEEVRNFMKQQKIYKPPGSSLIEVGGVVHEFLSGDSSHPQSNEIYKILDEIGRLLSLKGYKPAADGTSFDIDEEDKEQCLSQHSEKLAFAFGLINTKPGTVIRIVKNLRICEDCHSVMKLASEVFDRTVIIRDRNRFHHFKGGFCSCRDYW